MIEMGTVKMREKSCNVLSLEAFWVAVGDISLGLGDEDDRVHIPTAQWTHPRP